MTDKICIVTGAHGAIGKAICAEMCKLKWQTHFVCRRPEQIDEVSKYISEKVENPKIVGHIVDLASFADIKKFCKEFTNQNKCMSVLLFFCIFLFILIIFIFILFHFYFYFCQFYMF
jgi:NAD(P)-dependent dehydrogenase (short-subunit alcohol dehydrogenase family)